MEKTKFDEPDESWARLGETLVDYDVALFLGAGTSYPNSVPDWTGFVATLGGWSDREMREFERSQLSLISLCGIAQRRSSAVD